MLNSKILIVQIHLSISYDVPQPAGQHRHPGRPSDGGGWCGVTEVS